MLHRPCLLLIRHAQSENNAKPESERIADPPITKLGVEQSRHLARAVVRLRPTVLYCSAFLRSLETTRHIADATGIVPCIRQDIYEQGGCHTGYISTSRQSQSGLGRQALQKQYPGWQIDNRIDSKGWYDLGCYESHDASCERANLVRKWFETDGTMHREEDRVAMVIHADFKLRLLESFLERDDLEVMLGDVVNTSITRLSRSGRRWRLDYWNVFEHLAPELVTT